MRAELRDQGLPLEQIPSVTQHASDLDYRVPNVA
jgi:hypothetical protein